MASWSFNNRVSKLWSSDTMQNECPCHARPPRTASACRT
jgi:hypothetical protein